MTYKKLNSLPEKIQPFSMQVTQFKFLATHKNIHIFKVFPNNRTGHGTTYWFQIGKGVHQGCILSPCLFNLYAECIMQNARLNEAQAEIKIGEISITSDMQMTPTLWHKGKKN